MDAVITFGVRFSVKTLQPPCCITIPYILIKFVRVNRLKNTLYIGGNLVFIE